MLSINKSNCFLWVKNRRIITPSQSGHHFELMSISLAYRQLFVFCHKFQDTLLEALFTISAILQGFSEGGMTVFAARLMLLRLSVRWHMTGKN